MFNDMSCGTKDNETECLANAKVASLHARRFGKGQWCYWNSLRADVQFSVLRLHCPEVNSKAKDMVNSRHILRPIWKRLRLSRMIVSANQLSLYGAVAEICDGYESLHEENRETRCDGTINCVQCDQDRSFFGLWWPGKQRFSIAAIWRMNEKLSQQDKLSKFCMDSGFLNVFEIGQFFMTKDTADLSQFHAVACREYTLPREDSTSQPKGWIQGNTKIGPAKKVATSYMHGKHGVEIRIIRDNTHSWVRISHGSNKFVMNLNNNGTDIPEDHVEYALQLNAKDFACQSKAKAKPQRREPAGSSPRIVPIGRRNWIDIEPGKYSFSGYEVSKKVTFLLRQSQQVHREEDGAVHFWRIKENLRSQFPQSLHWSDGRWKACLAAGGGDERYSNTALMLQEQLFISELFKDIQDAILLIHHYRTMW